MIEHYNSQWPYYIWSIIKHTKNNFWIEVKSLSKLYDFSYIATPLHKNTHAMVIYNVGKPSLAHHF